MDDLQLPFVEEGNLFAQKKKLQRFILRKQKEPNTLINQISFNNLLPL